ncbi:Enhancing lycopene biosynthesis protein 2 [Modicisalibacter ilicicola DSM 19980]|uniref:Enhancing lycopene biosynthesis protein 2 n=1 Tax=Modicisalibacter ilicicola DSM 19980 TaxID=1121942 RepID=A0A1M4V3X0_9GAMM|nr:isoprenoid biosynthesis glyoxalase ElbB [Halomonas ilicicola]SHE63573.1 Enhancing lycopene biosynthesis protein 2 [Halomonas ilicicola DSM 19980]
MSKQVAVVLSGCGFRDGSEIYETTLTLLRLDQLGIVYRCFAPDLAQPQVIDHVSGEAREDETRNMLVESARLARGEIEPLEALDVGGFDGVILPGGQGVAKNLSNFAEAGADMTVLPLLRDKVVAFFEAGKPIGLMCYSSLLAPRLLDVTIPVTVGHHAQIAGAISSMGGLHKSCRADEVVVDREHRVVTTPAFMTAKGLAEAATGIFKLVDKLDEMMK